MALPAAIAIGALAIGGARFGARVANRRYGKSIQNLIQKSAPGRMQSISAGFPIKGANPVAKAAMMRASSINTVASGLQLGALVGMSSRIGGMARTARGGFGGTMLAQETGIRAADAAFAAYRAAGKGMSLRGMAAVAGRQVRNDVMYDARTIANSRAGMAAAKGVKSVARSVVDFSARAKKAAATRKKNGTQPFGR
jgi:hypothetical protein